MLVGTILTLAAILLSIVRVVVTAIGGLVGEVTAK